MKFSIACVATDRSRPISNGHVKSNKYTSWYRFKNPFIMTLDGTTGVGEIYQPEEEELVTMDEEESSGI